MMMDAEAIAILLEQTRNRDIHWKAVGLSWDNIPDGWVAEDDNFRVLLSRMPRRLMVFSAESGESAEVGDGGREVQELIHTVAQVWQQDSSEPSSIPERLINHLTSERRAT